MAKKDYELLLDELKEKEKEYDEINENLKLSYSKLFTIEDESFKLIDKYVALINSIKKVPIGYKRSLKKHIDKLNKESEEIQSKIIEERKLKKEKIEKGSAGILGVLAIGAPLTFCGYIKSQFSKDDDDKIPPQIC